MRQIVVMWNKFLDTFDRIRVSCLELFQETLLLLLLFGIITIFNSSLLLFHNGTLQSPPLCGQLNAHAWWTQVARQSLQSEKPENTVCFECKSKDEIHYFQRGLRECWGSENSWRRMGRDGTGRSRSIPLFPRKRVSACSFKMEDVGRCYS